MPRVEYQPDMRKQPDFEVRADGFLKEVQAYLERGGNKFVEWEVRNITDTNRPMGSVITESRDTPEWLKIKLKEFDESMALHRDRHGMVESWVSGEIFVDPMSLRTLREAKRVIEKAADKYRGQVERSEEGAEVEGNKAVSYSWSFGVSFS